LAFSFLLSIEDRAESWFSFSLPEEQGGGREGIEKE
jgi:hypothetical protein